jgi:hypothetical protein
VAGLAVEDTSNWVEGAGDKALPVELDGESDDAEKMVDGGGGDVAVLEDEIGLKDRVWWAVIGSGGGGGGCGGCGGVGAVEAEGECTAEQVLDMIRMKISLK